MWSTFSIVSIGNQLNLTVSTEKPASCVINDRNKH